MRCIIVIHLISTVIVADSQNISNSEYINQESILPENTKDAEFITDDAFFEVPITRYPDSNKIEKFRSDSRFKYKQPEIEKASPNWLDKFLSNLFEGIGRFFEWLFGSGILTFIVVVFIVFVVLVIVMRIAKIDIRQVFARQKKEELSETDLLNGEKEIVGFDKLIRDAISMRDYRLAIRYMYLRNLKLLSDRNYIDWAENKTNYSYQSEIQNKDIRDRFLATTILFDYIWYGEFPIEESDFAIAESKMNTFNKMITDER